MTKPCVLGIDPSGSFNEGKGITGFALLGPEGNLVEHSFVMAKDACSQLDYWQEVISKIEDYSDKYLNIVLSIEDYVLYASSAKSQINSEMETSKLIGAILMYGYENNLKIYIRNAAQVKNRWNNDILEHKQLVFKDGNKWVDKEGTWINKHCLDALRHALHCYYFEVAKKEGLK